MQGRHGPPEIFTGHQGNLSMSGDHTDAEPLTLLADGAASLGLRLSSPTLAQFRIYLRELQRWNTRINLTGLKTDREIVIKHFLDSLAVRPYLGEAASLLDLGSGAGFPGLVWKLVQPELALTLVEARGKKAAFLEYLAACLKLEGVKVEQVHLTPALARQWGPRWAAVTSRAAFSLAHFLDLGAPLLLPGGILLALKGPQLTPAELQAGERRAAVLRLAPLQCHPYNLPLSGEARLLITTRRL